MRTRNKVLIGVGAYLALGILLAALLGSEGKNDAYKPQNEFKLDNWIPIHIGPLDMSINKAVLYLLPGLGAHDRRDGSTSPSACRPAPNRVQTAVEAMYEPHLKDNIAEGNMDRRDGGEVVHVHRHAVPLHLVLEPDRLPAAADEHRAQGRRVRRCSCPRFALYAATANISIPLVLTLVVWSATTSRASAPRASSGYLKSWVPAGVEGFARVPIFVIEVISHFVRIISLSVRLFANILAGHLLILFMGGGLVVLLGLAALGVLSRCRWRSSSSCSRSC